MKASGNRSLFAFMPPMTTQDLDVKVQPAPRHQGASLLRRTVVAHDLEGLLLICAGLGLACVILAVRILSVW